MSSHRVGTKGEYEKNPNLPLYQGPSSQKWNWMGLNCWRKPLVWEPKRPAGGNPVNSSHANYCKWCSCQQDVWSPGTGLPIWISKDSVLLAISATDGLVPWQVWGTSLVILSPDSIFVLAPSYAQPHSKSNPSFLRIIEPGWMPSLQDSHPLDSSCHFVCTQQR